MARQYQAGEKLQTCTTRLSPQVLGRIVAYQARLQAQHPGLRVERSDALRDLLLKALALVDGNGPSGPGDAGGDPREAHDQDISPLEEDQSSTKAAPSQDQHRTTAPAPDVIRSRTGRKRPTAAKG